MGSAPTVSSDPLGELKIRSILLIYIVVILLFGCKNSDDEEPINNVLVVNYTDDNELTKADAIWISWSGDTSYWQGNIIDNMITLSNGGSCGDECGYTYNLILELHEGSLPQYEKFEYEKTELMLYNHTIKTMETGLIEIQDWNDNGIYSGRISGEYDTGDSVNLIFWWLNE